MHNTLLARFELLLYKWAGQWFPENRRSDLKAALVQSATRCGFVNRLEEFLFFLEQNPSSAIRDEIIQSILVGETYFFRDQQLWDSLKDEILPEIMEDNASKRTVKVWSAGCSTGEEVYSLAITIREFIPALNNWRIDILGTDISEQSLDKAKLAVYNQRSTREVTSNLKKRWFRPDGTNFKLSSTIGDMVHFAKHNLCVLDYPNEKISQVDIILCRNVLIYLSKDYVEKIIAQFCKCLSPHGWLILAPTEIPFELPDCLQLQHMHSRLLVLRPKCAVNTTLSPKLEFSKHQSNNDNFIDYSSAPLCFGPHATNFTKSSLTSLSQTIIKPDSSLLHKLTQEENFRTPLSILPSVSQISPSLQAVKLAEQARNYADKGDFTKALMTAAKSLDSCPTYTDGWIILAAVQSELGLYDEAIESLHRALYLDPNMAAAYLQLAQVMYKSKDHNFRRYINIFNKLVENMDDNTLLLHGLGLKVSEAKHLAAALQKLN